MAKEAKPEADVAATPAPKKSKKLLIIVAALLVVILAVVGGGVSADDPHELSDAGRHRAAFFCGGFLQPE